MRRVHAAVLCTALLAACGETSLAAFGQLRSPVALAVHGPTDQVFIASLGGDELRVFDGRRRRFLEAPAALFPLSIPTVANPTALAAADRFVFVLSGPDAALAFVDTRLQPGAVGPRSVDVGGFPLTLPLEMVPADLAAFAAAWPWGPDGTLADHALLAGVDEGGLDGLLLAVRPPVIGEAGIEQLPLPEAVIDLPGVVPTTIAIEAPAAAGGLRGPTGAPLDDCRMVAIGDGRHAPDAGHAPAIWLTRVRIAPDGTLSIDPLDPAWRFEVRVEVERSDGSREERVAPIRDLAFAPAPATDAGLAALATDPCAPRAGRLYAVLDPAYCSGARTCADVAVVDLFGPDGPALAIDAETGGPALYDLPATLLSVTALAGPFDLPGAFAPARVGEDGTNARLDDLPALGLLASTNGALYYLAGGLGATLVGPDPAARAAADPVFLVDREAAAPGIAAPLVRVDTGPAAPAGSAPMVAVPPDARPRDERWQIAHLAALPGLDDVGRLEDVGEDGTLRAPEGVDFLAPVAVHADADPRAADRLVPVTFAEVACEGFPVVEVTADAIRVDRAALANEEACLDPSLRLEIQPPLDRPWWVAGEGAGFAGRVAEGAEAALVVAGGTVQFALTTPSTPPPEGARWELGTTDGFELYAAAPGELGELPSAVAPLLLSGPRDGRDPAWRIFITYTGTDALATLDPADPDDFRFVQ